MIHFSRLGNDDNEVRGAVKGLTSHSFWIAVAFVFIILIAVGLEWFDKFLVHLKLIEAKGFLDLVIRVVVDILALIDVALLLGVVGKLGWRLFKRV